MARGFSVSIDIGARMMSSMRTMPGQVESQFGKMTRGLKLKAAETKLALKEMSKAMSPLTSMAIAGGLTFGFEKAIERSAELAHELQNLRNAGRSTADVAAGIMAANRAIRALPTTTLTDNLRVLNETTGAFGNYQHALENLTFNQRIGSMMQNMLGDKAGSPGEMFNSLVRAMEIRGSAQNATRYQREVGELYKAMIFTGGNVNPEQFLAYAQGANPFIKGMSERYMTKIAPSLIQEFGGDQAGTQMNTWMGTLLGKSKNIMQTEAWLKMGLLDPSQVVRNKQGNAVGWHPGAIKGTDLAMSDPLKWSEQVLIPALRAHGVNTADQLSLAKAIMPMFRDRNAMRLAESLTYDQDRARLHKDERLENQVPGAQKAYGDTLRRDPVMAWTAVKSSFANLSSVMFGVGQKESPVAVALVHIANGVNMLAGVFQRHPILGEITAFAMGVGAVGATLKTFGISLCFIRSGLRMITGPLGKVATLFMDAFGPGIARAILSFGPRILTAIGALSSFVGEGLMAAFALLSNPVGWTILAVAAVVAAGVLIYKFRDQIGAGLSKAWGAVKGAFLALPWASIGWAVADVLTLGIASKLPGAINTIRAHLPTWAGGTPAPNAPKVAGHRALGGPVWGGRMYLVGEHGPELWRAPQSGTIVPARPTQRYFESSARSGGYRDRRDAGSVHIGQIVVQGCHDPKATARAVRDEIKKLGRHEAARLSD